MTETEREPLFNNTLHGVTSELLYDWLEQLHRYNASAVQSAKPIQGASFTQDSVQFLFLTCDKLKMSSEVKYLSLELFDRFMLQHVQDLHDHVTNSMNVKTRGQEWKDIKKRVTNQVVLRVVSCVQIASKLTSHYRILSPNKAKKYLLETGHHYNTEGILQSELRILKTLNFCVSVPSPLVYLETLLEALGRQCETTNVKKLYGVCLHLLNMVYLQYNDVYERLHTMTVAGSPITHKDKEKFASVRADKVLLMVTIITTAAYIVDRTSHEQVMLKLASLTKIPGEDIADFTSVVLCLISED